jgi:Lon protease-like protein
VSRLPLFPLGTVLFPGVLLPLHVFEERYRRLVRDLLVAPHEERAFGVVAIREGREVGADGVRALHPVGCVARLARAEPYPDGRFDIVTTGAQRFRLEALDDSRAYLQGEVTLLDDPDGAEVHRLAAEVERAWADYREALGSSGDESPDGARALSYLVAAGTVLDLGEKQRLLEAGDTAGRLRAELALLRRESALLDLLPSLPAVELTRVPASPN